jgi:hypothetical protein
VHQLESRLRDRLETDARQSTGEEHHRSGVEESLGRSVYHGLRRRDLQSYLDEFVFRFNRRRTRHAAFRFLPGIAAARGPITYKMLISPETKV